MNDFSRKTFPQQIASEIEGRIQSGKYRIGDKLPTEPQLSVRFGVSRGTIREALKSLVSLGLLESRQGSGTYVVAKDRLQAAMYRKLSSSKPREIKNMCYMLEKEIAVSASNERKDDDLPMLRRALDEAKAAFYSYGSRKSLQPFHLALSKATHNTLLHSIYSYISEYNLELPEDLGDDYISGLELSRLYEALYEAVAQQDGNEALSIMYRIAEA